MKKEEKKKSIAGLYIEKYDIKYDENEEKRVRRFIRKLHEDKSIFSEFPFDYMIEEEQILFLNYLMTLLPERQIMANMEKVDVDRDYTSFVYQNTETTETSNYILKNEFYNYEPICLTREYCTSRLIIREPENNIAQVLQYLLQINENIINNYRYENVFTIAQGFEMCNFNYIKENIDYVINVILQIMVYRVLNNQKVNTQDVIADLSEKLNKMNQSLDNKLEKQKIKWDDARNANLNYLNAEKSSECFSIYIAHRSKLYEEVDIKQALKKEMMDEPLVFGDVPTKYIAEKIFLQESEYIKENIIITEGKKVDQYKKKILIAQEFIEIMERYGGRQCFPNCLQDLKVYFREIYVSKISYNKRRAPVIVKEYIDQVENAIKEDLEIPQFNKQSQYMFIREKINRGYFREKGLSKDYIAKIDFENRLYDLLLKCYLFYDVQDSLEFIYEINACLLQVYKQHFMN